MSVWLLRSNDKQYTGRVTKEEVAKSTLEEEGEGRLMQKGNCFHHFPFTRLVRERYPSRVMGIAGHRTPNSGQARLTTVYWSHISHP